MKITRVDTHVLLDPNYNVGATSSAQDDILVEIHTDEGVTGIGEADINPWIAKACITAPGTHTMGQGITELLVGTNPMDVEGIWNKMYIATAMNGRRGALINAIGAIDNALHDLRGKALGKPCYELLGGKKREKIVPYASLQPEVDSYQEYKDAMVRWALDAKRRGFRAAKLELTLSGPYAHMGLEVGNDKTTEVISAVRNAVGTDFVLMVDVQYAFASYVECLNVVRDWEPYNVFFLETPLWPDDIEGYAEVSNAQPIPVAAGEWLTTRFEFLDLINRGKIGVVQPDIGRVGGLTEAQRVCDIARDRGLKVVPHIWKTGLSIAAGIHLAAANEHIPFIEFLPAELCESSLRKELLIKDFEMEDGQLTLPTAPGLGVEINRDALAKFTEAAERVSRDRGI